MQAISQAHDRVPVTQPWNAAGPDFQRASSLFEIPQITFGVA
jgi:hypothetical protein